MRARVRGRTRGGHDAWHERGGGAEDDGHVCVGACALCAGCRTDEYVFALCTDESCNISTAALIIDGHGRGRASE